MCHLLLSINPQFVEQIICGKKYYEYRKFRCREDVSKILIYETSPTQRIIGEADITEIIHGSINNVWQITKDGAGVSYDLFMKYYSGKSEAIAYKLGHFRKFINPMTLSEIGVKCAPQSYMYVDI